MFQAFTHYGIHFFGPLLIALVFFKSKWKFAYLIMISTMLIDIDHLLTTPIFEANRCSINFHPLHSYFAIALYLGMLFIERFRILAIGLLVHILADTVDCLFM
ncbi:MAG: hypothetical protein KJN82_05860 [Bacteroidia bacterium]|nr:hypothetical protein [Bacteroidia bacterium]